MSASCAGALALPAAPEGALALSIQEAKDQAKQYGVPDLLPKNVEKELPDSWRLVLEPIGLARDANYGRFDLGNEPLIVEFYVPSGWVVSKPNIDFNGAAGTVQANDYGKGDSATLYVNTKYDKKLADMKRGDYLKQLEKALTQKGKGAIDSVKIVKFIDQGEYKIMQFDWEIYSGAGLFISRSGWASVCQVGDAQNLQVFWTGTVLPRWSKMNEELKCMADSFRVGKIPNEIKDRYIIAPEKEDDPAAGII